MPPTDFSGPNLKIERAERHIAEVEKLLELYISENLRIFTNRRWQHQAIKQGRAIADVKPHKHLPTALGDAIHNLRSSLDHAYCILIRTNGHTVTRNSYFPFDRTDWGRAQERIERESKNGHGPSAAVVDFIRDEAQPYPGGKHRLLDLHLLDIADKHQRILPTSVGTYFRNIETTDPKSGEKIRHGHLAGWESGDSNFQFRGVYVKVESDLTNAFDVTFGRGQPLTGQPILKTLQAISNSVTEIVGGLEKLA